MAFDTLGVNVTASGIKGVADDIGRLAASFVKYVGAVKKAEEASNKAAIAQSLLAKKMADKAAERQAKLVERAARAQEKLAAATLKAAQSQVKSATSMAGSAQTNLDKLIRKQGTLSSQVTSLTAKVASLTLTMRNHAAVKVNYDSAVAQVQKYEQAIKGVEATARTTKAGKIYLVDARKIAPIVDALRTKLSAANVELVKQSKIYAQSITQQAAYGNAIAALSKAMQELVNTEKGIPVAREKLVRATADAAEAEKYLAEMMANSGEAAMEASEGHQKLEEAQEAVISQSTGLENGLDAVIGMLNDSSGSFSGLTNIISTLVPSLSTVAGGFGQTSGASAALAGALGISTGALAGIVVGIGAAVLAFKAIKAAINIVVKVVQVAWQVFKKLVSVVWDVAKAIGKTLWSALTKIVSAPFRLISSLFGGVGSSMQRVLEMAIGMNLSRVWWQLGMKMRDMAKSAADAATEYQVTFSRLRALMLNEIIGQTGMTASEMSADEYAAAVARAQVATEQLVNWTSKLAVSTIYDAEDILNVYTLAMSYDFASTQAEKLTEAVLDFASGMGLGDTEMKRIIENFGQMRAQGKITGTELRDLARGSFVPVNEVLEQFAKTVGLVGDYDVPNLQEINAVLQNMSENGEITNETFTTMSGILSKLGADGKITRVEFETLTQDLTKNDIMTKFGLSAEQAGKALEGIKTGKLTAELNDLIQTGKITIDEFFEAFIDMVENKYPNAAMSMGLTMKAVKSNIQDYIATMVGWRLIAPVFETVAKHVQGFIQNTLMSESQIKLFDRMGLAFKNVSELVLTYSDALLKSKDIYNKLFGSSPLGQLRKFTNELLTIVGTLGTEDFAKKIGVFEYALKSIGLSFQSRNLVTAGIKNLNQAMTDIMNGVEVDPEILGQSLKDVFGTLWTEFLGPQIKKSLGWAWDNMIAPAINKLWQKMKDKFSRWKTEELMPGIKTFFSETLPGWISGVGTWLAENGPKIINAIGTFVTDILSQFSSIAEEKLGPDHPITLLLELLENLSKYATFKLSDPTSDINTANLENVSSSFKRLADAIGTLVTNKLLENEKVKKFIDNWNDPELQKNLQSLVSIFDTLKKTLTVVSGPLVAVTGSIVDLVTAFSNDKTGDSSGLNKMMGFYEKLAEVISILVGIPATSLTAVITLLDTIPKMAESAAKFKWDSGDSIIENLERLQKLFQTNWVGGNAMSVLTTQVDNLLAIIDKLDNVNGNGLRQRFRDIIDAIREFLNLDAKEWPPIELEVETEIKPKTSTPSEPINIDQDFIVNGTIASTNLPIGISYDNGIFIYNGASAGQSTAPTIEYVQPFTINGKLDFSNLGVGYTYDPETGRLHFEPVIQEMLTVLPIVTLEQPIVIDGKLYHNLPPGFYVNPITGNVEYKNMATGEIITDPIQVKQRLDLVIELLGTPGWSIDATTGQLVYDPPQGLAPEVSSEDTPVINWEIGIAPELILLGNAPAGFYIDENGNIGYNPPTPTPPATQVTIPVDLSPTVTLPAGEDITSKKDWLDKYLSPYLESDTQVSRSVSVDVEITPTTDAIETGSAMATDFASGFGATISTEMAEVDIPIPEITAERRRSATVSATSVIADIASVFNSDTTVASAGDTMMNSFITAISSKTEDAQATAASIASSLSSPLDGLSGTFSTAGANAVQGLWNGMAGVMAGLIEWWIGQVAYLNSIVPTMNMQNSPSRLYRGYGEDMMKGLQLGLESGQEGAVAQMHDAAIELRQALGAINTGTISPQQYSNVSNTTNWNVNVATPIVASTPIQAYEILRMRAR